MKTLIAAFAAFTLIIALASCAPQPKSAPQTVQRAAATAAPAPTPTTASELEEPAPAPEPMTTLAITDVLPMAKAATLDPPDYVNIFEVRDDAHRYFADTAIGPRFLLTHAMSLGNPPAPGNVWQELATGDRIEALGSTWSIVERVEASKSWPTDDPVLKERTLGAGPGTLVLITCVPRWEGLATHNLILIAELEGAS